MSRPPIFDRLLGRRGTPRAEKDLERLVREHEAVTEEYIAACTSAANAEAATALAAAPRPEDYASVLTLYPEWQRILFIHIPKCGGTSVRRALVQDAGCAPLPVDDDMSIYQAIVLMSKTGRPDTLQGKFIRHYAESLDTPGGWHHYLHVLCAFRLSQQPQSVFTLGHRPARQLSPLMRGTRDRYVSTVRDPNDILRSFVAYRVHHVLQDPARADSAELLARLSMDSETFTAMVSTEPRKLTEAILSCGAPSIAEYLAFGDSTDVSELWRGIREQRVLVCHVSEQVHMLGTLLQREVRDLKSNTSGERTGLSAEFTSAVESTWTEPFVDTDSRRLYDKLQASGIFGLWKAGGSPEEYMALLQSA